MGRLLSRLNPGRFSRPRPAGAGRTPIHQAWFSEDFGYIADLLPADGDLIDKAHRIARHFCVMQRDSSASPTEATPMTGPDEDIREAILAVLPVDLTAVSLTRIEMRLTAQGVSASRRTLQRHLGALEREERVVREGRSVAITYRLAQPLVADATGIVLSEAGRAILDLVSKPVIAKRPVTYHQEFLDGYQPNETFYLSESTRSQLQDMGRTREREKRS